jgi:hypothetical protein
MGVSLRDDRTRNRIFTTTDRVFSSSEAVVAQKRTVPDFVVTMIDAISIVLDALGRETNQRVIKTATQQSREALVVRAVVA